MLQKAISLAVKAHGNQLDKNNELYILHPLRVMLMGKTEDEMIVGVLHDVLEDTDITLEKLKECGFSNNILNTLIFLTRNYYYPHKESYRDYIHRVSLNSLAKQVKQYDLWDNTNPERINKLNKETQEKLLKKYYWALSYLYPVD